VIVHELGEVVMGVTLSSDHVRMAETMPPIGSALRNAGLFTAPAD
jgi:hypothetical protein